MSDLAELYSVTNEWAEEVLMKAIIVIAPEEAKGVMLASLDRLMR